MATEPHNIGARSFAVETAKGVAVGVGLGLALMVLDVGGVRTLTLASGAPVATAVIVIVGAALTFLPVVIVVVLGLAHAGQDTYRGGRRGTLTADATSSYPRSHRLVLRRRH